MTRALRLLALIVCWLGCQLALAATTPAAGDIRVRTASLLSEAGERGVALPHVLDNGDIDAGGSRVRYRLAVELPKVPRQALGIFINKLSLAGAVYLNGHLVDQCAHGEIERIRCLHRPQLFKPALQLWQAGRNDIEIEIYGTPRQASGLSEVRIDDADRLYRDFYAPRYWWVVTVNEWLAFSVFAFGLLSLLVGFSLRGEATYRWYGLTCMGLVASFTYLIPDQLPIPVEWLNWLIVTGRLLAAQLFVLTCLSLFERLQAWQTRLTLGYGLISAVLFYLAGANRWVVFAAYMPLLLTTPLLIFFSIVWSVHSRSIKHIIASLILIVMVSLGIRDWLMFGGHGSFEFVYLVPYGFTLSLLFIGFLLVGQLIESLHRSRELSASLEAQVAARTAELQKAHERLTEAAIQASRNEEREQLLQDMHDGFGSQLASARLLAETGQLSRDELPVILQECIADLYLVADTLSHTGNTFADSLADLKFRSDRRVGNLPVRLHWRIHVDSLRDLPQRTTLQALRIIQEALNNALKHARAANIEISATHVAATNALWLEILDDGIGIPATAVRGRGLNNMQQRARTIGAQLDIMPRAKGTAVTLRLMLPPLLPGAALAAPGLGG